MKSFLIITLFAFVPIVFPQPVLALSCIMPDFLEISARSETVIQAKIIDIIGKDSEYGTQGYYKIEIQKSWLQKMPDQIDLYFDMWTNYLQKDEVYLINLTKNSSTDSYSLGGCVEVISSAASKFVPTVRALNSNFEESGILSTLYNSEAIIFGYATLVGGIFVVTFLKLHKKLAKKTSIN